MTEQENKEEESKDPMFKPGDLDPMKPTIITLESATEVAEGESKYGQWWLWAISVEGVKVHERDSTVIINNYSGKAIMFPSKKLQPKLLEATNGTQEGVKIELTMVPKKNKRGSLYTTYEIKVISAGETPATNVVPAYSNFITDFKKFSDGGVIKGTKEDFIQFAKSDTYNIKEDQIEKLWTIYDEKNKLEEKVPEKEA